MIHSPRELESFTAPKSGSARKGEKGLCYRYVVINNTHRLQTRSDTLQNGAQWVSLIEGRIQR